MNPRRGIKSKRYCLDLSINELRAKQMFLLQSNFTEDIKLDALYFVEEMIKREFVQFPIAALFCGS